MKSVGEAMGIGRSFAESFQKALRSLESGLSGLDEITIASEDAEQRRKIISERIKISASNRLLMIAQAIREGISTEQINKITSYDPWFLEQIKNIIDAENKIKKHGLPKDFESLLELKKMGFSDKRLAKLTATSENDVRKIRQDLGVVPVYKRVDSCAAEFDSVTSYMYSCYES